MEYGGVHDRKAFAKRPPWDTRRCALLALAAPNVHAQQTTGPVQA